MKLISSINSSSVPGNVNGELRMNFSLLNKNDLGPNGTWQVLPEPPGKYLAAYVLPNGDAVTLNLNAISGTPGQLYLQGAISVSPAAGGGTGGFLNNFPAPPAFLSGAPHVNLQSGRFTAQAAGVTYNIGVDLVYYWDGTNGQCTGRWWANWK